MIPELILFQVEHLKQINLRPFDEQVIMGVPNMIDQYIVMAENGIAYTGIDKEGNIIGIGGVAIFWPGVGFGWVLTSELLLKYKIWFHRTIKDILELTVMARNLHRIEGLILKDHIVSQRWAERLGFIREGLLRQYDSSKNDYYLYARIITCQGH